MRGYEFLFCSLVFLTFVGCTPPPLTVKHSCDGSFSIKEESPTMRGDVIVTSKPNVRDGVSASIFNLDPTRKEPIILVHGSVEDVCKDASISYTGPTGRGTTVNLLPVTIKAAAPPTAYAAQDGIF